ncbi:MAG: glycosyltransferase family 2 protein [Planctomycetota bacterium]
MTPRNHTVHGQCGLIVIPAASEANRITEAVETAATQDFEGLLAIVIAVNGPSDGTVERACAAIERLPRDSKRRWRVVETEHRSKPAALNRGEWEALQALAEAGAGEPAIRIFLDADVRMSRNAVSAMARALRLGGARLVQPSRCSDRQDGLLGRIFGASLCSLPWVRHDVAVGGVFAVGPSGRLRWPEFPRVAADDEFVFSRFAPAERSVLEDCWATHPIPGELLPLLRQQRRWREARRSLKRAGMAGPFGSDWTMGRRLRVLALRPWLLGSLLVVRIVRVFALLVPRQLDGDGWRVWRGAVHR